VSQSDNLPVPRQPDDWPVQAADTVERVVQTVKDRTTKPVMTVAKAVVYGLIVAAGGITALVLLSIALVRVVNVYLPGDVWGAHLLVGTVFVIAGLVLWATRRAPEPETS